MKSIPKVSGIISGAFLLCLITTSLAFAGNGVKSRVSTQWVADNLDSVKIIDLSFDEYNRGHLPGALTMQWGKEVYSQGEEFILPPNLSEIKRILDKMGLKPKDHIVLYDSDNQKKTVTRIYWALKFWNFSKVSVMEGGLARWQAENRNVIFESSMAYQYAE